MVTGGLLLFSASRSGESASKLNLTTLHRIAAVCYILAPFLVFMSGDAKILLRNIKLAFSWDRNDFRWFYGSFMKLFIPSTTMPAVAKFNAGQKLNMLIVMSMGVGFVVSGLIMWLSDGLLLAWFIHASLFPFAVLTVLGHMYMAVLHRSTRPSFWAIIHGDVDREWADHHHPRWAGTVEEPCTDEDPQS